MNNTKYQRNMVKQSDVVAQQYGCTALFFEDRKNKAAVVVQHNATGETRRVFCAKTPSCHRAMKNHLSCVKRVCIELQ